MFSHLNHHHLHTCTFTEQLKLLPRASVAEKALENSFAVVLNSIIDSIDFSNLYAPEHLILAVGKAEEFADQIQNAGSVFLGNYYCESAGDYASGNGFTLEEIEEVLKQREK